MTTAPSQETSPQKRKRLKPGERRAQILQALAAMLQEPGNERITTAALSKRLQVSEAALYRHFASKTQMFEGLLDFIEQAVLSLVQQIAGEEAVLGALTIEEGRARAARIASVLLQFAEKNPGMVRMMVGQTPQGENQHLQVRMNQLLDKVESTLRQCLRPAAAGGDAADAATRMHDAQVRANLLMSFVQGRWLRFVRTGFKRLPTEHWEACVAILG